MIERDIIRLWFPSLFIILRDVNSRSTRWPTRLNFRDEPRPAAERTRCQISHANVRRDLPRGATLSQKAHRRFDKWRSFSVDVDECSVPDLQTELCRYGCINTPGSYRCAEPTELKDQPILDSLSITCLPGYEQTSHGCIGESDNGKIPDFRSQE